MIKRKFRKSILKLRKYVLIKIYFRYLLAVTNYTIGVGRREVCRRSIGQPMLEKSKDMLVDIRLTKKELNMLDEYFQRMGVSRPQGLRDGIKALGAKK